MYRKLVAVTAALTIASMSATGVSAQTVNETNPNGSIQTAQNLDGSFGLMADPNIQNSTTVPHVTVIGNNSVENEQDYYRFTVALAGSEGIFDIDGPYQFDTYLTLRTLDGTILAQNDDAAIDAGSTTSLDSFLTYTFANPGTYVIGVGACCANGGVNYNAGYRLNVSLTAPGTTMGAVPEPSTWAMMLLGFGAIGTSMRRRQVSALAQIA